MASGRPKYHQKKYARSPHTGVRDVRTYILADEKHSRCLTEKVYLPTIVRGRVLWHLGYSDAKSAAAFTESYGAYQRAALEQEPSYR